MKPCTLITAAALSLGGVAFMGCDNDKTARNTGTTDTAGDKVEKAADRVGEAAKDAAHETADAGRKVGDKISDAAESASAKIQGKDKNEPGAPDAEGIRDILASSTEAALTEKGLNDLVERFVDADRNRIGKAIGADFPDHTAIVKQFRADWKAKYGKDFDIKKEEAAFPPTMFTVSQGEVGRDAPSGTEVATGQRPGDVDKNLERGRNIATVAVKESNGMPALNVPLIHEAPDNWRIDVPDTIDANKLVANVCAHLKAADDMKDQWPADVNQAYGVVGHHVLEALLDMPVQK
jgi:hypothetical protein